MKPQNILNILEHIEELDKQGRADEIMLYVHKTVLTIKQNETRKHNFK